MLELVTPAAVHRPLRRPPASVFLVTTAKSGPGISTSTVAKARNSPYVAHVIMGSLPTRAGPRITAHGRRRLPLRRPDTRGPRRLWAHPRWGAVTEHGSSSGGREPAGMMSRWNLT